MKTSISFLITCFILSTGFGQTLQEGIVRELNSDRTPLPGVFIKFEAAPSTNSDDNGLFQLLFQDKKAGDIIFLEDVRKRGYELVNHKDFEVTRISNTSKLPVDIILAKKGVVDAAKKVYYDISDKALIASYEKQKSNLKQKLNNAQLTQFEFEEKLHVLQKKYDFQKANLYPLADKFARTNFDDVEPVYEKALKLFKSGKIEECIDELENAELISRVSQNQEKLKNLYTEIKFVKDDLKKTIPPIHLLAQSYILRFEFAKAETQYEQLLSLDSTNVDILIEVADFYQKQHLYKKATLVYNKIISNTYAEEHHLAKAYRNIGRVYIVTNSLKNANNAFGQAFQRYKKLLKIDSTNTFYKDKLAISYADYGESYFLLGDLEKALDYFKKYNSLEKKLYRSNPENKWFKRELATSYNKIGETYTLLDSMERALYFFEKDLQLTKELYESDTQDVNLKNDLAVSFEKLGDTYRALNEIEKAMTAFEERARLGKELYDSYPKNIDFINGLAISFEKLGETHRILGNGKEVLFFFEEYNRLAKEIHDKNTINKRFKYNLAISYSKLGEVYTSLSKMKKALSSFNEYNKIAMELCKVDSSNVTFMNILAASYYNLGFYYGENKNENKSIFYYNQAKIIWEELTRSAPKITSFRYYLDITNNSLKKSTITYFNNQIKEKKDTVLLFQLYNDFCDTLRTYANINDDYKVDLVDALRHHAWYGFFLKEFRKVEKDARECIELNINDENLRAYLATALLLQGKEEEALVEYILWKDKPFGVNKETTYRYVFLNHLEIFEEAGIIPVEQEKAVQRIRNVLTKH